ncbi:formate/nitrite transporter family protein [Oceanobacillus alkalisoli]|uniref:formate/nitrite transporter family protein n=1 Tax=Oceanobacillus alkalisoli TaxID=2925113 RepID=UPI001F121327|nr:formate/nitrite transporter family protein [Oceanobacillus alkalisoli]MCF3942985.1 formate/nitrite transporter family protein [Oceanobacillus alkalisoli]
MDYVKPNQVIESIATAGVNKSQLSISHILIKAMLAGALLGYATTLAFTGATQTGLDIVGALIFPTGFVMTLLLNLELVTGSFAVLPVARFRKKIPISSIAHNFTWAFIGNLAGSLIYAALYVITITYFGNIDESIMIQKLIAVAESKTLDYKAIGMDGMVVVFVKAMLCNFMVTLGVVMNATSTSTFGKIAAMWIPIFIFFAQGFEHAVVNMFVIPAGMMVGADVNLADWWVWNQIPVTIGNFVSGFLFVALALHVVTREKKEKV